MVMVMCGLLMAGLLVTATPRQAEARPPYMGWWTETYPDVAKKNDVKTSVKCNVCHFGTKKKDRNDYGKAIAKALPKKNLKKTDENKEIFQTTLKTVAGQKSATEGKTFGDLLDTGELPSPAK
jgi:hypothetical protein